MIVIVAAAILEALACHGNRWDPELKIRNFTDLCERQPLWLENVKPNHKSSNESRPLGS